MSGVNQIVETFEGLGDSDRAETIKVLSNMMRNTPPRQTPKKKVNGFMGYRAYYSSLFNQLPQKERSPILTTLWQQDPLHKEWDFMCAVYSAIREYLTEQNITLQTWFQFAVRHMGIPPREGYMHALGWELTQQDNGTYELQRIVARGSLNQIQPMNGLGLFLSCLNGGLPVVNPEPIITQLSDPAFDVICINTPNTPQSSDSPPAFHQFAKQNPSLAMSAIFGVPSNHGLITQGVQVLEETGSIPQGQRLDIPMPSVGFPDEADANTASAGIGDAEFDAILRSLYGDPNTHVDLTSLEYGFLNVQDEHH
ncbi:Mat sexual cell fertilization-promoting factor [Podospora fimiseda]|uniref:Mat sexual cell fertilization-promoting factor n=1 Tax=Podospora fimiseda TaxID=252190 RepID=A0AAN7BH26_9PEZI|nr:Mat sexual cell fertilization-promoting factor [Podospora fimiseda]